MLIGADSETKLQENKGRSASETKCQEIKGESATKQEISLCNKSNAWPLYYPPLKCYNGSLIPQKSDSWKLTWESCIQVLDMS